MEKVLIIMLDAAVPPDVGAAEVLVVAPALNSRLRHWLSDDDAARRYAEDEPRRASTGWKVWEREAVSATPIRCRRLPTRCRRSQRTRS